MSQDSDGLIPVRVYQKQTSPGNTSIFAIVKVNNVDTEVEISLAGHTH